MPEIHEPTTNDTDNSVIANFLAFKLIAALRSCVKFVSTKITMPTKQTTMTKAIIAKKVGAFAINVDPITIPRNVCRKSRYKVLIT